MSGLTYETTLKLEMLKYKRVLAEAKHWKTGNRDRAKKRCLDEPNLTCTTKCPKWAFCEDVRKIRMCPSYFKMTKYLLQAHSGDE